MAGGAVKTPSGSFESPRGPAASRTNGRVVEYQQYIDGQLRKTRARVKWVDLWTSLVVLGIGVLGYLLLATIVDHWLVPGGLGFGGRLILLVGLLIGVGVHLAASLVPFFVRRVNPVYAAAAIERGQPMKNTLVNFLLLRKQPEQTPEALLEAMKEQAAVRLSTVPGDAPVDRSTLIKLALVLTGVLIAAVVYALAGPKDALRSVGRVIVPWADIAAPTRVAIEELSPGDVDKRRDDLVEIKVRTRRMRADDQAAVYYSPTGNAADDTAVPLKSDDLLHWSASLPAGGDGLKQDVYYYVKLGDAESPRYRVRVLATPVITVTSVRYEYPEYTKLPPRVVERQGDLKALEGTRAIITAETNQAIKTAHVAFDKIRNKDVELAADESKQRATGGFPLALNKERTQPLHTSYVLRFVNIDGQENPKPIEHKIDVVPDQPPEVKVTEPTTTPEKEIELPVNGVLRITLAAQDADFELANLAVVFERFGAMFREERLMVEPRFGPFSNTYNFSPTALGLKSGDRVTFLGRATDNKSPQPNVAETPRYTIVVTGEDPRQQQQPQQNQQQQPQNQPQGGQPNQQPQGGQGAQQPNAQNQNQPNQDRQGQGQQGEQGQPQQQQQQGGQGQAQPNQQQQQGGQENQQPQSGMNSPPGGEQQPNQQPQQGEQQPGQQQQQGESNAQQQGDKQQGQSKQGQPQQDQSQSGQSGQPQGEGDQQAGKQKSGDAKPGEQGASGGNGERQAGNDKQEPIDPNTNPGDAFEALKEHFDKQARKEQDKQQPSPEQQQQQQQADAQRQLQEQQPGRNQQPSDDKQGEGREQSPEQNAEQNSAQMKPEQSGDKGDTAQQQQPKPGEENGAQQQAGDKTDKHGRDQEPQDQKAGAGKRDDQNKDEEAGSGKRGASGGQGGGGKTDGNQSEERAEEQNGAGGGASRKSEQKPGEQSGQAGAGQEGMRDENAAGQASERREGQNDGGREVGRKPTDGAAGDEQTKQQASGEKPGDMQGAKPGEKPEGAQSTPAGEQQESGGPKPGQTAPQAGDDKSQQPRDDIKPEGGNPTNDKQGAASASGDSGATSGAAPKDKQQGERPGMKPGEEQPQGEAAKPSANSQPSGNDKTGGSQGASPNEGTPEQQELAKPRDKSGGATGDKQESQGNESKSPSGSRQESDSQGAESGDRSGKGEDGGGMRSPQKGTGSAGSNSAGDQGAGAAQEEGDAAAGNEAGDKLRGKPQEEGASRGAGTEKGDGSQMRDGGDKPGGSSDSAQTGGKQSGEPSGERNPRDVRDGDQTGGNNTGGGGLPEGSSEPPAPPRRQAEPGGDEANLEYTKKVTDLTLDRLKNDLEKGEVDPELLKRFSSREALEQFVKRWDEMRRAAEQAGPQGDAAKKNFQDTLKSLGLRPQATQQQAAQTGDDDFRQVRGARRSAPPAKYADQYRAYTTGIGQETGK